MSPTRNGNFTSSEIYKLMTNGKAAGSFGVPFHSYIEECNMERRLGRALDNETDSKATSWGKLLETRAFNLLGIEYELCSNITLSHPEIPYWKGSPDGLKGKDTVVDFKCPMTLKSFCQLVDAGLKGGINLIRAGHKDGEKFYWQLVSNAVITDSKHAELIIYIPYLIELEAIRDMASSVGEGNEYAKWIYFANDDQLPYIHEGGYYKNMNTIRFEVPQDAKDALTKRVKEAGKLLINH